MRMTKTVALHTLGCKLNYAETVTIGKQFLDRGYSVVAFGDPADVTVINTCSVTERADRECRQLIRRAHRNSRDSIIVITGCYAQLAPEEVASIDGVHLVLGTKEKFNIPDYLAVVGHRPSPAVFVSDIDTVNFFGPAFSTNAGERTRAYLKVQDGCDYSCSFCTIPLARGASRSQNIPTCVSQAQGLVALGYREIVLTGVNVGDYGKKGGTSLLELLRQLVQIEGLERIRISSIEPNLLSSDLLDFVASEHAMCKHFHIPLQSGDDETLHAMRRRYATRYYRELVHRVKEKIPECGIGADVIVGFPGETPTRFESTCSFLTDLPISYLHVFTYSERVDTPAANFSEPVSPGVRSSRSRVLRNLSRRKRRLFSEQMVGKTVDVLLEGQVDGGTRYGFTDNYVRVGVPLDGTSENTIVPVTIVEAGDEGCIGRVATGSNES